MSRGYHRAVRHGIVITRADPRGAAELAAVAEGAGWDGVFTWDGVAIPGMAWWDPWVTLDAMAMRTERVTIGAMVVAPSRRRPWKAAREALAVDHLPGGRLVPPVGLGALDDVASGGVGEATDARTAPSCSMSRWPSSTACGAECPGGWASTRGDGLQRP